MEIKTPPASYYLKKAAGLKPQGKAQPSERAP